MILKIIHVPQLLVAVKFRFVIIYKCIMGKLGLNLDLLYCMIQMPGTLT